LCVGMSHSELFQHGVAETDTAAGTGAEAANRPSGRPSLAASRMLCLRLLARAAIVRWRVPDNISLHVERGRQLFDNGKRQPVTSLTPSCLRKPWFWVTTEVRRRVRLSQHVKTHLFACVMMLPSPQAAVSASASSDTMELYYCYFVMDKIGK